VKLLLQKLVPYTSAVYSEHALRELNIDGNTKVLSSTIDRHVEDLAKAAEKLRDMVKELEEVEGPIKGYIIYREESEEELKKRAEEEAKVKALIA